MDQTLTQNEPTSDEKLLAGLSHLSIIAFSIIAPFIIWLIQRQKSQYVAFHALQSLFYHLATTVVSVVLACAFIFVFFRAIASGTANEGMAIFADLAILAIFVLMTLVAVALTIYGIVGAVMAFQGKPFRYILAGRWAARATGFDEG